MQFFFSALICVRHCIIQSLNSLILVAYRWPVHNPNNDVLLFIFFLYISINNVSKVPFWKQSSSRKVYSIQYLIQSDTPPPPRLGRQLCSALCPFMPYLSQLFSFSQVSDTAIFGNSCFKLFKCKSNLFIFLAVLRIFVWIIDRQPEDIWRSATFCYQKSLLNGNYMNTGYCCTSCYKTVYLGLSQKGVGLNLHSIQMDRKFCFELPIYQMKSKSPIVEILLMFPRINSHRRHH